MGALLQNMYWGLEVYNQVSDFSALLGSPWSRGHVRKRWDDRTQGMYGFEELRNVLGYVDIQPVLHIWG